MGLYMNDFGEDHKNKAEILINDHGAKQVTPDYIDPNSGKIGLVVICHPMWDAALVLDCKREYDDIIEEILSGRTPRLIWLSIDVKTAEKFSSWKLKEEKG